ncbi:N-6 DNA methylase [Hymenobacter lutimineralis]|uniref:N-6 DNA methylase n=1 Tax=Hymenobacter lutimineralis TaxID=2606448 RepID=UPI001CA3D799|nr:N-6 DNA methylase [Hymenobacter lutimineralis]
MAKTKKQPKVESTAQRLSAIVKSCRNFMRKDKGLNGDLDRLPILTWMMFLKFLDDMEQVEETKAELERKPYRPAIQAPYRWRDWAHAGGPTGDDLLAFVANEQCIRPDGTEGPGLFYYLRGLQSETGRGRQDIIANVFRGTTNRMENGYLMRDVVNEINKIHFNRTEEVFTLSHLYESLLREMRDAAGDSGEFYTPRPVVRLMVEMLDPRLGETILDPATGTGGFLAAAFDYLKPQVKTVEDNEVLQQHSIRGGEAKSLPYLLCQMNLLLHGLDYPSLDYGNSLRFKLSDIGDDQRVDVLITNPPFGGEEERGILNNFPADKQTAETATLFMQLIMRRLRVKTKKQRGGRAAVVVPNGTLFELGIAARVKQQLLAGFNLHTVVRLPEGIFAPYTDIPANILFFEQGMPTTTTWYYEVPVTEGRRKYSKTKPLLWDDLADLRAWWTDRQPNTQAWQVDLGAIVKAAEDASRPFSDEANKLREQLSTIRAELAALVLADDRQVNKLRDEIRRLEKAEREARAEADTFLLAAYNLDHKNPSKKEEEDHREPGELLASVREKEGVILGMLEELSLSIMSVEADLV